MVKRGAKRLTPVPKATDEELADIQRQLAQVSNDPNLVLVLHHPIPCVTKGDCAYCGKPATCIGKYSDEKDYTLACDDCCGHGNEDGCCMPLPEGTE